MVKEGICTCFLFFLTGNTVLKGQAPQQSNGTIQTIKNFKVNVLPVVFYLPETGLGYGVLGLSTFSMPGDEVTTGPYSIQ